MKEQHSERTNSSKALRVLWLSLAMLFAYAPAGLAQAISIRGTVTDDAGAPMAGVYVNVQGTTTATITTPNGGYAINAPASGTLVFSFLGMTTQEIAVGNRTLIDVTMSEDATRMNEVVVVGYGSVKRQHLISSVAITTDAEIKKSIVSNLSQALVGKLPGITTQQASGAPGSDNVTMMIRGQSSYSGSTPLIIVDGIERPMNNLNPNDVESISVLKDAGATAVYGIKGANGVILVTTKKGVQGKTTVNYRGSVTLSQATTIPKMMNGTQYMQYYNLALDLDGLTTLPSGYRFTQEDIDATHNGDTSDGIENTNWMSPMEKTTIMHQHSLSVSGGNDKVKYFISGGYLDQNGIFKGLKNQRGNFRSNIDITPIQNLKVSLNVAANVKDYYKPGSISFDNWNTWGTFHLMLYSLPYVPKELNGEPTSAYRNQLGNTAEYGTYNSGFSESRNLELNTSANIEYSTPFLKGMKVGFLAAWDMTYNKGKTFSHNYYTRAFSPLEAFKVSRLPEDYGNALAGYSQATVASNMPLDGNLYQDGSDNQNVVLRPYISYSNTFGKNTFGALFLYEQTQNKSSRYSMSRTGFDMYELAEMGKGDSAKATNDGASGHAAWAGLVGRVNYAYDDKYLAEVAFRYDATYLFNGDNRWKAFPSLSLGWLMSREDFFKSALPKVEYFKLRASIGENGSTSGLQPWFYLRRYGLHANSTVFGGVSESTIWNEVSYPIETLTWERTRTINGGFEMSAWNGLLGIEFDYFYKLTYNILQNINGPTIYPPSLGGHHPKWLNDGRFDSRGFELVLKHRNRIGKFNYSVAANLSYTSNRILARQQADNTLPWQNRLGTSVGDIWGYRAIGLYQNDEQLLNAPKPPSVQPRLGDIMYEDINGDGQINANDQVRIARDRMPKMMFGLMVDGEWRGLDFTVQLQGGAITDLMLQNTWSSAGQSSDSNTNPRVGDQTPFVQPFYGNYDNTPLYIMEGSWTPENTNAEFPRLSISKASSGNSSQPSDWWKRNGAYLRLKNVTIGYSFPRKWMNKINVDGLRVYASGYNLLTATEFKYIDPESATVPTGYYPQQRTFSFGLDLTF